MSKIILKRSNSTDQGTFGTFTLPSGKVFHSLELPDKDNKRQVSCIPKGIYQCKIVNSPKFGHVYGVLNVLNRANILIHAGNYGGDVAKGFKSNIQGCILLGKDKGILNGQQAVLNSKKALAEFMEKKDAQPFVLEII